MIGSNTSAQHPLAYARITAAKKRGAKLITVDPRRTPVATLSDIHLAIRPGSNLALVNALMHAILFEEKAQDEAFINERTEHFDALRADVYKRQDYTRLAEEQGLCWPCPTPDHPGTPYLHAASFTRGRGLFTVNDVPDDLGCATDETYPFTLLTGRVSHHYHTGTMTRRSWALDREYPEAFLDMHPDDAAALRLKDNWKVRVLSLIHICFGG